MNKTLSALSAVVAMALEYESSLVQLRFGSDGLRIVFVVDDTEIGKLVTSRAEADALVNELNEMAGLYSRTSGTMRLTVGGSEHHIMVRQKPDPDPGEAVYLLAINAVGD